MKLAATILAAGRSRRMGSINKLLLLIENKPILKIVCENVIKAKLDQIILVTGYQSKEVLKVVPKDIIKVVQNHDWKKGMMTSIFAGMSKLKKNIDGNIIILGDMPFISAETIIHLKGEFEASNGQSIVYPIYQDRQANPVIFPKKYFSEILMSKGDKGCKRVLKKYPKASIGVRIKSEEVILDCDTKDDYFYLNKKKLINV